MEIFASIRGPQPYVYECLGKYYLGVDGPKRERTEISEEFYNAFIKEFKSTTNQALDLTVA